MNSGNVIGAALALGIVLFFSGLIVSAFKFSERRDNAVAACIQAGGVPVVGDKGFFHVCLDPKAVIKVQKQ